MSQIVSVPDNLDIVKKLLERKSYTPDFDKLKYQKRIPVFVYGSLKSGRNNAHYLRGAELLGMAHTVSRAFAMYHNNSFPMVWDVRPSMAGEKIRGELYACSPAHVTAMDYLEGNPDLYRREEVHVVLEDYAPVNSKGFKGREVVKAFMYLTDKDVWPPLTEAKKVNYPNKVGFEHTNFYEW